MNILLKFLFKHSLLCTFHFKLPPFFLSEEMWQDDTDSISGTLSWATWLQQQCAWCTTLAYRRSPMSSTRIRCLSTGIGGWGGLSSIMQKTVRNRWFHSICWATWNNSNAFARIHILVGRHMISVHKVSKCNPSLISQPTYSHSWMALIFQTSSHLELFIMGMEEVERYER